MKDQQVELTLEEKKSNDTEVLVDKYQNMNPFMPVSLDSSNSLRTMQLTMSMGNSPDVQRMEQCLMKNLDHANKVLGNG